VTLFAGTEAAAVRMSYAQLGSDGMDLRKCVKTHSTEDGGGCVEEQRHRYFWQEYNTGVVEWQQVQGNYHDTAKGKTK
jgi:hypothetical protein